MAYTLQTIITHNYYKKKQIDGTCSIAIGSIMRVMVYYGGYPFVVHELPLENCALLYKASPTAQSGWKLESVHVEHLSVVDFLLVVDSWSLDNGNNL